MEQKKKFYRSVWFLWISMAFMLPLGLYLLWKSEKYTTGFKQLSTVLFTVLFLIPIVYYFTIKGDLDVEVHITKAEIESGVLYVEGETNLIDGTILTWDVENITRTEQDYSTDYGFVEVQENQFSFYVDVSYFAKGEISLWLAFAPMDELIEQPEKTKQKYGERGQNLMGDQAEVFENQLDSEITIMIMQEIMIENR